MVERLNAQSERGARDEHFATLPGYRVPRTKFDAALHALARAPYKVARDGRRAAMIAALDYSASWEQIKHWRSGRRRPPQWIIELMARKLESYAEAAQQLRAS